jgi:anti-sigma B factor antagonist
MKLADVHFSVRNAVGVARLSGEIDLSNAADLATSVIDATPSDVLGVVVDLTEIDYLDSAGIHLIYRLRERLSARGQELRLVIPALSPVNDALRLAGVKRHVAIAETVDDALRQWRPGERPSHS